MLILRARRIRNLDRHLNTVPQGHRIVLAFTNLAEAGQALTQLGFTAARAPGEALLPPATFGPVCRYNAEGKYVPQRDQPMETVYRLVEWHWTERHGDQDVERSDFREVPYRRYPRLFMPPPSVELGLQSNIEGQIFVTTPAIEYSAANAELIRHTINVFLEIFRECNVLTENLGQLVQAPLQRLNWRVLPPGRRPWAQLQAEVDAALQRTRRGNQAAIRNRLETINTYEPNFIAIGEAGFLGYTIFGFPTRNIFVLESIITGNATYVFGQNWQHLSMLTKAEILDNNLQRNRIIHRLGWHEHIRQILS